jgi:hypothetical protein
MTHDPRVPTHPVRRALRWVLVALLATWLLRAIYLLARA